MSRKISGAIALALMAALAIATKGVLIPLIVGVGVYVLARGGKP